MADNPAESQTIAANDILLEEIYSNFMNRMGNIDEILDKYIENGGDINYQSHKYMCLMSYAVQHGLSSWIDSLSKHGADVNYCHAQDVLPLFYAIQSNQKLMVKKLLEVGADPLLIIYYPNKFAKIYHINTNAFGFAEQLKNTKILEILNDHLSIQIESKPAGGRK